MALQTLQNTRYGAYLHEQHFFMTLLLALMLHAIGFGLYQLLPKEIIEQIPVRVLNIKIGRSAPAPAAEAEKTAAAPVQKPAPVVKRELPKPQPVKKVAPPVPAPKIAKPVVTSKVVKKTPPPVTKTPQEKAFENQWGEETAETHKPKQYVREDALAIQTLKLPQQAKGEKDGTGAGSGIGNSFSKAAEIESRYTQTLSLWLNRFKVYPREAREAGIGGTVMLRIRIDRQGTIMRYFLERPSGHAVIDQAISTMVNAANPVPAVPPYYPDTRPYLEFLVPIHFKP